MPSTERRLVPRKEVRAPLRFRTLGNNATPMLEGELRNISERGIYFTTNRMLEVGMPLELFVSVPSYGGREALVESRCTARVIHVRTDSGAKGQMGIGAAIERIEPPGARESLARLREGAPAPVGSRPERTGSSSV